MKLLLIDHIIINTILDFEIKSEIINNDISNYVDIFCVLRTVLGRAGLNDYIVKQDATENGVRNFRDLMSTVDSN